MEPESAEIPIAAERDIVAARQQGRALALALGFSSGEATLIATAISELARNIVSYAALGQIELRPLRSAAQVGLRVVARDRGPGIADVEVALRDGYSTSGGLGVGLPGVRRLMDEFAIESSVGDGTTVTVTKWRP